MSHPRIFHDIPQLRHSDAKIGRYFNCLSVADSFHDVHLLLPFDVKKGGTLDVIWGIFCIFLQFVVVVVVVVVVAKISYICDKLI